MSSWQTIALVLTGFLIAGAVVFAAWQPWDNDGDGAVESSEPSRTAAASDPTHTAPQILSAVEAQLGEGWCEPTSEFLPNGLTSTKLEGPTWNEAQAMWAVDCVLTVINTEMNRSVTDTTCITVDDVTLEIQRGNKIDDSEEGIIRNTC